MKTYKFYLLGILVIAISLSFLTINKMKKYSKSVNQQKEYKIIFLHHSTGRVIYEAGNGANRIIRRLFSPKTFTSQWFLDYNSANGTNYTIREQSFPNGNPYGWENYPFDYYNIWVKNAGDMPYLKEPTLEILTKQYDLIIFKHCFPVSDIEEDINKPDINSREKRLENYKLQYLALKEKLLQFPNTKFLIWTGAALVQSNTTQEKALRAKTFFDWVKNDWDTVEDNIFLWDFYELETEGGLYLKNEYANSLNDSHPGKSFAEKAAPLFCQRIIDVIQSNPTLTDLKSPRYKYPKLQLTKLSKVSQDY